MVFVFVVVTALSTLREVATGGKKKRGVFYFGIKYPRFSLNELCEFKREEIFFLKGKISLLAIGAKKLGCGSEDSYRYRLRIAYE